MRTAVATIPIRQDLSEEEQLAFGRDLWNAVIPFLDHQRPDDARITYETKGSR